MIRFAAQALKGRGSLPARRSLQFHSGRVGRRPVATRNDRGVVLHRWRVLGVMAGEKRQPRTFLSTRRSRTWPGFDDGARGLVRGAAKQVFETQISQISQIKAQIRRIAGDDAVQRGRDNAAACRSAETTQRPAVVKCAAGERACPAGHLACCRDKARKHGQTRPPTHEELAVGAGRPEPPPDLSLLPAGGIAVRLPTLMPEDRDAKRPLFSSGFARVRRLRR